MQPLLVSTRMARSLLGIGNTKLYELINTGALEPRKIGRKTLITTESIRALALGMPATAEDPRS